MKFLHVLLFELDLLKYLCVICILLRFIIYFHAFYLFSFTYIYIFENSFVSFCTCLILAVSLIYTIYLADDSIANWAILLLGYIYIGPRGGGDTFLEVIFS